MARNTLGYCGDEIVLVQYLVLELSKADVASIKGI